MAEQVLATLADGAVVRSDFDAARELIESRRHVSPKRLGAPGPTPRQLDLLLTLAAAAPDHGSLTPWRFVLVPPSQRGLLGDAFAAALLERDPAADAAQLERAREKAHHAPVLLVAIARLSDGADIPPMERMISLGAAIQNMLIGAQALGFSSGLASGQAMSSKAMRRLLDLRDGEYATCFICIGTAGDGRKAAHERPRPCEFATTLGEEMSSSAETR